MMYWKREGINVIPYLEDSMLMKHVFLQCAISARKVKSNSITVDLNINAPKCHLIPVQYRRQMGFDVKFDPGE